MLKPIMTALVAAALLSSPGHAQDYPARPVRVIVPYAPGGGLDAVGRPLFQRLGESLRQPFVMENRPGAGTTLGTAAVARAAPDGHTLLLTLSAITIGPALYPNLPYDPVRDFAPVSWVGTSSYILAVHPSVPVGSVKAFIALARAKPDALNFSSPGAGTDPHMAVELFKLMSGTRMIHIPYNGGGPAASAVMGGQVDFTFLPTSVGTPLVRAGKLKGIAITTAKRSPVLPDLPTIAESGVGGYSADAWSGVLAPAGTPGASIALLSGAIARAVQGAEMRAYLLERMVEPVGSTPETLAARLREDVARWQRVVREARIRLE